MNVMKKERSEEEFGRESKRIRESSNQEDDGLAAYHRRLHYSGEWQSSAGGSSLPGRSSITNGWGQPDGSVSVLRHLSEPPPPDHQVATTTMRNMITSDRETSELGYTTTGNVGLEANIGQVGSPPPASLFQNSQQGLPQDPTVQELELSRFVYSQIRDELRRRELLQANLAMRQNAQLAAQLLELSERGLATTTMAAAPSTSLEPNMHQRFARSMNIRQPHQLTQMAQYPFAIGAASAVASSALFPNELNRISSHGIQDNQCSVAASEGSYKTVHSDFVGETQNPANATASKAFVKKGKVQTSESERKQSGTLVQGASLPTPLDRRHGFASYNLTSGSNKQKISSPSPSFPNRTFMGEEPSGDQLVAARAASTIAEVVNDDRFVPMSLDSDKHVLTKYQCLIRLHACYFAVTADDLKRSAQGRNKPLKLGQVGIICTHCKALAPKDRPRGASYFPSKLFGIYQAMQNLVANHFLESCRMIPTEMREEISHLKLKKDTLWGGGRQYWVHGARQCGVIEQNDCLVFGKDDNVDNDSS